MNYFAFMGYFVYSEESGTIPTYLHGDTTMDQLYSGLDVDSEMNYSSELTDEAVRTAIERAANDAAREAALRNETDDRVVRHHLVRRYVVRHRLVRRRDRDRERNRTVVGRHGDWNRNRNQSVDGHHRDRRDDDRSVADLDRGVRRDDYDGGRRVRVVQR